MSRGVPLTVVACGRPVVVCRVDGGVSSGRLAALGVVPGAEVTKLRDLPVPVIRIEDTDIAVDRSVVRRIYVRRQEVSGNKEK